MSILKHPTARIDPLHHEPSDSPASTTSGKGLAQALGWFSIGLGLAEIWMPEKVAAASGVHNKKLLQLFGLREIVCGMGILGSEQAAGWMWARVAGDTLDLATVGAALIEGDDDRRNRAGMASVALTGIGVLDVICATQLSASEA